MDCDGVARTLEMWIDDEMDAPSRKEFSAHVDGCAACRERVASETRLEKAIRERLPGATMPAETWTRITRRLARAERSLGRGLLIAAAVSLAASLLVGGSFWWWWASHKPDLEMAAVEVQKKLARHELRVELESNSSNEVEKYLYDRLGMKVNLEHVMSGRCGSHDVKFLGATVVSLGDVKCACLSYTCCRQPVSVVLVPSEKLDRFPEVARALHDMGSRLEDRYRLSTRVEVRMSGSVVACLVGDHPIADLAALFEKI